MSEHLTAEARRYLSRAEFARLWAAARERYERNGRVAGRAVLAELSDAECHALSGLLGHGSRAPLRPGGRVSLPLEAIERALLESRFELTLKDTLQALGGPLTLQPQRRAADALAAEEFWAGFAAHPACKDPRVAEWVGGLRCTSQAPLARAHSGAALGQALGACELLAARGTLELATLSARAGGDPHCLDFERPGGKLFVALLAYREGLVLPRSAGERRALLGRCGVHYDTLSSDVLCLGLRAHPGGQLAGMLDVMASRHLRLTYAHLSSERLRFDRGLVVHTCENPVLVARAEQLPCPPALVCTDGQRTTAVALLLDMLTDCGAQLRHHGDFDVGGLNIATLMAREHGASPWRYDEESYEQALAQVGPRAPSLCAERLRNFAHGPFEHLAASMERHRVAVYEEDVLDVLIGDLASAQALVP